jgi:hypothetical protein
MMSYLQALSPMISRRLLLLPTVTVDQYLLPGVEYFNKRTKEFTHYNTGTLSDLVSDMVWTILDDHNGNLYIGHVQHGMSVLSLNDGQVVNFRNNPSDKESIPGNEVRCIYKDTNNNIWVVPIRVWPFLTVIRANLFPWTVPPGNTNFQDIRYPADERQ